MPNKREVIVIEPTKQVPGHLDFEPKRKKRVCAYARVSTNNLDQLNSYNAQIDEYSKRIKEHPDWEFAGLYADEGLSGTSYKRRTQFNQMIEDAKSGLIDMILVKSVSRFSRNTIDSLSIIRELREIGVEVFFEKENTSSLDSKVDFHLTIFSSIAQEESRNISENIKWGIRKRYKQGHVRINTKRFLGYDKDEDGNLVINAEEAQTVEYIFMLYILGYSYTAICKKLIKEGYKNGYGKVNFSPSSIMRILKNEKYVGDALLQKTVTIDYLTHKTVKNEGHAPQYYIKNNHPPIINRETFEGVQQLIKNRTKDNTSTRFSNKYPLSGFVYCGSCHRVLNRNHYRYKTNNRVVLTCKNNYKDKRACDMKPADNDQLVILTNHVLKEMGVFDEHIIDDLLKEFAEVIDNKELYNEISLKENEIFKIEKEIGNLIDFRLTTKGKYDDNDLRALYDRKKEKIKELTIEIEYLKNDLANSLTKEMRLKQIKDALTDEKVLFRDSLITFCQKIIQVSPTEFIYVMGAFDLSKEYFTPLVPKLLNVKPYFENSIYIESLDTTFNYRVVEYNEGMLDI